MPDVYAMITEVDAATTNLVGDALDKIGSGEDDVPVQVFLGPLVQPTVILAASPLEGRLSNRSGRRKGVRSRASTVYGLAMSLSILPSPSTSSSRKPALPKTFVWSTSPALATTQRSRGRLCQPR
jgi:hypothetical protein